MLAISGPVQHLNLWFLSVVVVGWGWSAPPAGSCSSSRPVGHTGQQEASSLIVPPPPYLPTTTKCTLDLARVTLLSALAGQDLVPEQTLQVQETDEAGRRSSGG